jgi:hypothetical protein
VSGLTAGIIIALLFALAFWRLQRHTQKRQQELIRFRQEQQNKEMKAKYGVRLVGINGTVEISSTDAQTHNLDSTRNLAQYYSTQAGARMPIDSAYRLQLFQMKLGNVWQPYNDLGAEFEFSFAEAVGQKLRYVPPWTGKIPLAMRGITVSQLKEFHCDYPTVGSREKQYQMLAPLVVDCEGSDAHGLLVELSDEVPNTVLEAETKYKLVCYPTYENKVISVKGKHIKTNNRRCPPDTSFMEWKIGDQFGPQLPQAIISYSWAMPWDLLIEFLEDNIGDDGVVWIDILACDQHKVNCGNMEEIALLPSVIEFVGQTYVMPGTLARLWCM